MMDKTYRGKITFIYHSGFSVELNDCSMLFDYWKGNIPVFDDNKPLYVFSSHAHADHFNPEIFKLRDRYKDIVYILSDDIHAGDASDIVWVKEELEYQIKDINVTTFHSTDEGVAFYVRTKDLSIMFFGDLNWWHWEDESDTFNREQEIGYKKEIDKMKDLDIDIALGPALDKRLKPNHWWGIDYFLRHTNAKKVFPMHFFGSIKVCREVLAMKEMQPYKDRIVPIDEKNQEFLIT